MYRFALEMAFVSEDKDSAGMGIVTTKSIDDEHTPGVFEVLGQLYASSSKINFPTVYHWIKTSQIKFNLLE